MVLNKIYGGIRMINDLFKSELKVINTGMPSFKENLDKVGVKCVQVDWKPSIEIDESIMGLINSKKKIIEEANKKALDIILSGTPF
jgi:hypothetical protein